MKRHVHSLQKGYEVDQYVVQKLIWSGMYLRSNLSYALLYKILKLVPLTATVTEVYVPTTTSAISDSYDSLVDTLNHTKSLNIKDNAWGDVTNFCDAILLDTERLESAGEFKPEHLGYIIRIFEDTSDYRFYLWATQKYKDIMEFVKKPFVCDEEVMQTDDIITYGLLVQYSLQ